MRRADKNADAAKTSVKIRVSRPSLTSRNEKAGCFFGNEQRKDLYRHEAADGEDRFHKLKHPQSQKICSITFCGFYHNYRRSGWRSDILRRVSIKYHHSRIIRIHDNRALLYRKFSMSSLYTNNQTSATADLSAEPGQTAEK